MKYFLLLSAFILLNFMSFAQFEDFDLSKYKLPDMKRHQLDFEFEHNSGYSNNHLKNDSKEIKYNFDESLDATYSYLFNSRKKQSNYHVRFSSDIDIDRIKTGVLDPEKIGRINLRLFVNFDEHYYLKEDKFFIHVNSKLDLTYNNSRNKQPSEIGNEFMSKTVYRDLDINPEINLGFGFGRIEPVGDLRQAIYILEDLYKNQRLERIPNEDEILKIATKITHLNNQRFFDSRIRKIYEIKSVDSLLRKMDLIENQDAVYFTSLNDLWYYGREPRLSGTRFQIDFIGELFYYFDKNYFGSYGSFSGELNEWTEEINQNWESIGLRFSIDSYRNIGLKWQRFLRGSSTFNHYTQVKYNGTESIVPTKHNTLNINSEYGYNWYLNTRTNASISMFGNFSQYKYPDKEEDMSKRFTSGVRGSLYYYFSPRLRLSYYIDGYFELSEHIYQDYDRRFVFSNHLRLNYSLF